MDRFRVVVLLVVAALVVAACGGDEEGGSSSGGQAAPGIGALGFAAAPGEADRKVEVKLTDSMAFEPPTMEFKVGETITFVVENTGKIVHEFVLGDEGAQAKHAEHMQGEGDMAMSHDEPNALNVEPGQTKELTWTFTEAGTTLYGCHVPGHYDAGMKGEITVTE